MNIEKDKMRLHGRLLSDLRNGVETLQKQSTADSAIYDACAALLSMIKEDIPLCNICDLRSNLQKLVPKPDLVQISDQIRNISDVVEKNINELRNNEIPVLPDRIIKSTLEKFPNSPWYCATFTYPDPESGVSGSVRDSHFALVRLPEEVINKRKDLGSDFFLNNEVFSGKKPMVRLHSECILGDACGQGRCDCGQQLQNSLGAIDDNGIGFVVYLRQEGRGVGLNQKMKLLQREDGRDEYGILLPNGSETANTAFTSLGYASADLRKFDFVNKILLGLGFKKGQIVSVISDNPKKVEIFNRFGYNANQLPAVGKTVTIASTLEMLEKSMNGYKIDLQSNGVFDHLRREAELLHQSKRIDDRVYTLLTNLHSLIQQNSGGQIPEPLKLIIQKAAPYFGKAPSNKLLN